MQSLDTFLASTLEPTFVRLPQYPGRAFWMWQVIETCVIRPNDVDELEAAGWQQIPTKSAAQFLLNSQLSHVLNIRLEGIEQEFLYAPSADVQHAQQYPVLLAQQTIEDINTKVETPAHRPKHLAIGSHALIFDDKIALYDLTQLGDAGQQLYEAIQKELIPQQLHEIIDKVLPPQIIQPKQRRKRKKVAQQEQLKHDAASDIQAVDGEAWQRAQLSAQQLATLYWHYHQTVLKQDHSGKRLLPEPPHVLERGGGVYIIAPLAVRSIIGAYSNAQSGAKGWGTPDQKPVYHFMQNKDSAQIELRPTPGRAISAETTIQSLWQQVQKVSDLDGDVFLALLAQWIGSPKDEEGYVWISAEHILHYRGIQPRQYQASGGAIRLLDHRQDDLADIATSMERIRDTHITLQQRINAERAPGQKGRTKKRLYEQESYIVTIAEFIRQHELTDAGTPTEAAMAIAWRFKPGSSLDAFIDGPNKQIAWLLQQALSYDPYHEFWEKRLSRYFTFQMRMDSNGSDIINRRVGEIFEELSLPVNRSDPEKTRHRFEKAINRLCSDGQLSIWSYQELLDALPTRKWLDIWFDYHIRVTPSISSLPGGQTIRKNIP